MDYNENYMTLKILMLCYVQRWRWLLLSIVVALAIALVYLQIAQPTFVRRAEIMINEFESPSFSLEGIDNVSNLGLLQNNSNINNEMALIGSMSLMQQVVRDLDLATQYRVGCNRVAYGSKVPIRVTFLDIGENQSAKFTLTSDDNGQLVLKNFHLNSEKIDTEDVKCSVNQIVATPVGRVKIEQTSNHKSKFTLQVIRKDIVSATDEFMRKLNVAKYNNSSTIVSLVVRDNSIERATHLIEALIEHYNRNWLNDRELVAKNTLYFIDLRLSDIKAELDSIDHAISTFKSQNLIPDIQTASNLYLTKSTQSELQLQELHNQLYVTSQLADYLEHQNRELLPVNSGVEANVESLIAEYNGKVLRRDRFVAASSSRNPLVKEMDKEIDAMRRVIQTSVKTQLRTIENRIKQLELSNQHTIQKIADNPSQAEYLLAIERQQKVKGELYLHLLQKREETMLNHSFATQSATFVSTPYGSSKPAAPSNKMSVMILALLVGLAVPIFVIYTLEVNNAKIRSADDLSRALAVLGEIHSAKYDGCGIVVERNGQDAVNESFRVLRTNLDFRLSNSEHSNVVMVTSVESSCDSTFVAINLAASLAIKGGRVLVVDGNLHNLTLSNMFCPTNIGLSDYLVNGVDRLDKLVVPIAGVDNLFVLPVGSSMRNAMELFDINRFRVLLDMCRKEFDYILVDSPSMSRTAESLIIERCVDHIIVVAKVGVTDRARICELESRPDRDKISVVVSLA